MEPRWPTRPRSTGSSRCSRKASHHRGPSGDGLQVRLHRPVLVGGQHPHLLPVARAGFRKPVVGQFGGRASRADRRERHSGRHLARRSHARLLPRGGHPGAACRCAAFALDASPTGSDARPYGQAPFDTRTFVDGALRFSPDGSKLLVWVWGWSDDTSTTPSPEFWALPWPTGQPYKVLATLAQRPPPRHRSTGCPTAGASSSRCGTSERRGCTSRSPTSRPER